VLDVELEDVDVTRVRPSGILCASIRPERASALNLWVPMRSVKWSGVLTRETVL
jgi:hypothetical protein